jgi:hypothetical protein
LRKKAPATRVDIFPQVEVHGEYASGDCYVFGANAMSRSEHGDTSFARPIEAIASIIDQGSPARTSLRVQRRVRASET